MAAALLGAPLSAQPVSISGQRVGSSLLNFNSLAEEAVVSNQYSGVTISNGLCASSDFEPLFFDLTGVRDRMQVTNFRAYTSDLCNGVKGQAFTFTFASPILSFGFLGVTSGGSISLTTSNGSLAYSARNGVAGFFGFTDVNPFSSVQVNVSDDGYIALDDISYLTIPPAPEEQVSLPEITALESNPPTEVPLNTSAEDPNLLVTPEPSSIALLAAGLIGAFGLARRRNRPTV